MGMRNILIAIIIILIFATGLYASYAFGLKNQNRTASPNSTIAITPTEALLGGDQDEHGCIPSAGYSWCEAKQKCLREWEEKCIESAEKEIEAILASKYNKSPDEVKVTITKQNDTFAGGSVLFGEGGLGEGGMFLAKKTNNVWEVVFDGNGSVDCDKLRDEYGFSDDILKPNFCD